LLVGLVVGAITGWQLGGSSPAVTQADGANQVPAQVLQELRLKATGAHGANTFAMTTGPISDAVEGLFCLDFITGDLQCFVMQTNKTAAGVFKTNILGDLPVEKGKAPAYVIVTGGIEITAVAGNARPANTIVYVADANTGKVVGYSLNWNAPLSSTGVAQAGPLNKVFTANGRAIAIRE